MKPKLTLIKSIRRILTRTASVAVCAPCLAIASEPSVNPVVGKYLEVRSCDVYTGFCFANSEMGLAGREGMMVWSIEKGSWNGVSLEGLHVIAVIKTDQTLGDVRFQPRRGQAALIVDSNATTPQREALVDFVRSTAGLLVADVRDVRAASITATVGACGKMGCATVSVPGLVEISTRCFTSADHVCGNEEPFYPPMTSVEQAMPAFSEVAAYHGDALNVKWEGRGQRNVFLARFSR